MQIDSKFVLLTTYKRDGTPVGTVVNVAHDGDRTFFRTWRSSGKAKRLRGNADVEVAPSSPSGKTRGAPLRARARLLQGEEAELASRAIRRRFPFMHGVAVPLAHRLARYETQHYELTPRDR